MKKSLFFNPQNKNTPLLLASVMILGVFLLWGIFPWVLANISSPWPSLKWEGRGALGDAYGILNTLFSGLGLVALISTLHLQNVGLKQQALEIANTQEELRASIKAQGIETRINALNILFNDCNVNLEKLEVPGTSPITERNRLKSAHWREKQHFIRLELTRLMGDLYKDEQGSSWPQIQKLQTDISNLR